MEREKQLRILAFGAHPDDCDVTCGGTAALWARAGHVVQFVSVTNGDAGHHEIGGAPLAWRRRAEAAAAGKVIGISYLVLDHHDGELEPSLANRREIIGLIRDFRPHLSLSPRPYDYHPDHRYTALLIQDAAYMVTVPNIVAHHAHLPANPVICYVRDHFLKPVPFQPDVAVIIDEVIELKWDMLHCHTSQMYEWLPYNGGYLSDVPAADGDRRRWLAQRRSGRDRALAGSYRDLLISRYGRECGQAAQYAEAFEVSEYGAPLTPALREQLFP
ncbi:MAG: PIG-L family deacetylase [Chloroflexi bacterium]|nr:PIG-L family deacetylase [Chloroflexota bacterium]